MIFNIDSWIGVINKIKESVTKNTSDIALNSQTLGYTKKNLLKNECASGNTYNGVNIVRNDDNSITLNGTCTASFSHILSNTLYLPNGKYKVTDGRSTDSFIFLTNVNGSSSWIRSGVTFEVTSNDIMRCALYIPAGTTLNNITVYPMILSADITDDTYEPYAEDVNTRLKKISAGNSDWVLLGTYTKAGDYSTNGHNLSDYAELMVCLYNDSGNRIFGSQIIPISLLKTITFRPFSFVGNTMISVPITWNSDSVITIGAFNNLTSFKIYVR